MPIFESDKRQNRLFGSDVDELMSPYKVGNENENTNEMGDSINLDNSVDDRDGTAIANFKD